MTERPIIFSAPMVRALLAGRKTMTRRLATSPLRKCAPGDRLWVRESVMPAIDAGGGDWRYRADYPDKGYDLMAAMQKWTPSIHMPRSACRITLEVTAVKIERLQEITPADAEAEGVFQHVAEYSIDKIFRDDRAATARLYFLNLWEKLHGLGSWDINPEVVALSFRRAAATAPPPQRGTL